MPKILGECVRALILCQIALTKGWLNDKPIGCGKETLTEQTRRIFYKVITFARPSSLLNLSSKAFLTVRWLLQRTSGNDNDEPMEIMPLKQYGAYRVEEIQHWQENELRFYGCRCHIVQCSWKFTECIS